MFADPSFETNNLLSASAIDPQGQVLGDSISLMTSPKVSFQSSTTIFDLFSEETSATTTQFTISSSSSLLTLSDTGDLTLFDSLFFTKDNSTRSLSYNPTLDLLESTAKGISVEGTGFAEEYSSTEALQEGDVVVLDPQHAGNIMKAPAGTQNQILGIVSVSPAFTGGHVKSDGRYNVVMMGTVRVALDGPASAGQSVALSAGVDGKASVGDTHVFGTILSIDDSGYAKIVFMPSFHVGNVLSSTTLDRRSGVANIPAGSTTVHVTFDALPTLPILTLRSLSQVTGSWWTNNVTVDGLDITISDIQTHDSSFNIDAEASAQGSVLFMSDLSTITASSTTSTP